MNRTRTERLIVFLSALQKVIDFSILFYSITIIFKYK